MYKKIVRVISNYHLRASRKVTLISLIIIFALFCYSFTPPVNLNLVESLNSSNGELEGQVVFEPESGFDKQSFIWETKGCRVLVYTALYPKYQFGDYLSITCAFKRPEAFDDFDYPAYLAKDNIYWLCYYPSIKLTGFKPSGWRSLYRFKENVAQKIYLSLPEPEAGLAAGLILGYKKTLAPSDSDDFARVGLSHIIAISGSHITLISALILDFFLILGLTRRQSFYFSIIFLSFYVVLTGLQASALRAAIMGILVLFAYQTGRLANLLNILLISAALMMMFKPGLLRLDLGFQLSFAAVLGIIYIYPRLNSRLVKRIEKYQSRSYYSFLKNILNTLSLTLACQLATAPLLIFSFGRLSLIAPLSNLLVLWIFPWLMMGLICALLLSLIFPGLNLLFFYPNYLLLKLIFLAVNSLATWPGASISL